MLESSNYKLLDGYINFAKSINFYNNFFGVRLDIIDMDMMVYYTYKNICNYNFYETYLNDLNGMYGLFKNLIRLYGVDSMDVILGKLDMIYVRYIGLNTFYGLFCFFCESVGLLEISGNIIYRFLWNVSEFNFEEKIGGNIYLDSFLLLQRLVILLRRILELHKKRINVLGVRRLL